MISGRIDCDKTFSAALHIGDIIKSSLFLSKLNDDPGIPTVAWILSHKRRCFVH